MKRIAVIALLCLFVMPFLALAGRGDIQIEKAYSYATASYQKNGAVFLTIMNNTNADLKIISAHAEISEKTELHTHIMDGTMMMMREVPFYDVPKKSQIYLEPAGHHIMLMGLEQQLRAGDSFELTLSYAQHDPMIVDVMILAPGVDPNDLELPR